MAQQRPTSADGAQPAHRPPIIASSLALALLLLSGCATLNLKECQTLSPATLGLRDGQQGYGLWRLDKHIASCARFGITLERNAYLAARAQGLLSYCTADNGLRVGERGESYEFVCPAALEPAFLRSYQIAIVQYRQNNPNSPFGFGTPWPRHH